MLASTRRIAIGISIILAGILAASSASAVKMYGSTASGNQQHTETTSVALMVDGGGTTPDTLKFKTTAAKTKLTITFSAECSVQGVTNESWLNIDIQLDGVSISPTDEPSNEDAFCTSHGTNAADTWATHSITVLASGVTPGKHTVQVLANIENGDLNAEWWVGDVSLVVVVEKK